MKTTKRLGLSIVLALAAFACGGGDDGGSGMCAALSFTPPPANQAGAQAACSDFFDAVCERSFTDGCMQASGFIVGSYANVDDCKSGEADGCTALDLSASYPHPTNATACATETTNLECASFADGLPESCASNYLPVPPAPTGCQQITAGMHDGEITGNETLEHGVSPAATFCICLDAGQTVDIEVLARGADSSLGDSRLALVGPDGSTVAYNDDVPSGGLSRISGHTVATTSTHMIVVSGYPYEVGPDLGQFSLSVALAN